MESEERELICLRDFLQKRIEIVQEDYFVRGKNVAQSIMSDMNLTEESLKQLQDICNPNQLKIDLDPEIDSIDYLDSEHLSLIDYVKDTYGNTSNRIQSVELKFKKELARLNEQEPNEDDVVQTPDLIITVQLSQPLNPKLRKLMWSEDFFVLGENYLSELKDKITCFRNEIRIGEFSENPDELKTAPIMKDCMKSGFFFIEDTFYNDQRPNRLDCSDSFISTAIEKNVGRFCKARMEETKFIDLTIRLGFPYLFTHIGNCEHLLIFNSVKLLNPATDCYCRSLYPLIKDRSRGRFSFCWGCNKLYAKWIVCNSEYAVDDPTFLCERCLRNTHYELVEDEETGQTKRRKLFNFKAYHFSQV